jgi:hypothetical protein
VRRGSFIRRRSWLVATLLAALSTTAVVCSGCSGTPPPNRCRFPDDLRYDAATDSLGLDAFSALPASERAQRDRLAAEWAQKAARANGCVEAIQVWRTAVGLAPDRAASWIELAETARWLHARGLVDRYLDAARVVLSATEPDRQPELRWRAALTQAWYHYERGEWREGLVWADSATALEPDDELTLQIRGLLLAGSGQWRFAADVAYQLAQFDVFSASARWILGMNEWYRGRYEIAYGCT